MLLTQLRRLGSHPEALLSPVEGAVYGARFDPWEGAGVEPELEAQIVEDPARGFRAIPVGNPEGSEFSSFLDGIQRAQVFFSGPVPVVYAYAAAVIRTRVERRLRTYDQEEREAVFFPFRLLDPALVRVAEMEDDQIVDTGPPEPEPLPLFPPMLYARAAGKVNQFREGLERTLADRWCRAARSGWLLVDGSLTLSAELSGCPRAVGLVKTHQTRFFDGDSARVVFGLEPGQRTSVFQPRSRRFTPIYSWYLRLRSPARRDIFWGLVRVEVPANDLSIARADEVSRWLLSERAPLSLPDARWDRLLYPIHDCEEYLRARAPAL